MFKIRDGRETFFQWDLDRQLIVDDAAITEVHFCNRTDTCSLVVETYQEDGLTVVNVPNILLQSTWRIHVYAYDTNYTKHEECYEVVARTKPADYIYTETECWTVKGAVEKALEEAKESGDFKGDKGEKGDAGSIEFVVVAELPTTNINTGAIYLLPKEEIEDGNNYSEYIYNNNAWEKIGDTSVEVDLSEYAKKEYVDNGFIQKQTATFDGGATRGYVYYINVNNEHILRKVSVQALTDSIPLRSHTGNFYVNSPSSKYECANKGYVDDAIANIPTGGGGESSGSGWSSTSDITDSNLYNAKEIYIQLQNTTTNNIYGFSHLVVPDGNTLGNYCYHETAITTTDGVDDTVPYWYYSGSGISIGNDNGYYVDYVAYK